jgi:hypothetical protein
MQLWANVSQENQYQGRTTTAWTLPESCFVTLTDRRLMYVCRHFTKGSTWFGFGPIGFAVAGTAMAVSAVNARRKRAGRAAVGQIRHEWLTTATLQRHPSTMKGSVGIAARGLRTQCHVA